MEAKGDGVPTERVTRANNNHPDGFVFAPAGEDVLFDWFLLALFDGSDLIAVVALELGECLREEAVCARVDDALHGLREHRRLHLRGRVRRAVERHAPRRAALEVVPLEP